MPTVDLTKSRRPRRVRLAAVLHRAGSARRALVVRRATVSRLARYAVSGGLSALSHFGVGLTGTAMLDLPPLLASSAGFAASVVVSYVLQRAWVFRSAAGHGVAGPRFLTVTAAAFTLNALVLWLGAEVMDGPYALVQAVALVVIPVLNYVLNSRWTFARR